MVEGASSHDNVRPAKSPRIIFAGDDHAGGPVAARRNFVQAERLDDRPLGQHLLQRDRLAKLG